MTNNNETIAIPLPLAQAILDYLSQRPYREVCELIPALLQAGQPAPAETPTEDKPSV